MAYAPHIVPWKIEWNGYAADELAHSSFLIRADKLGIPLFFGCYFVMALVVSDTREGMSAASAAAGDFATLRGFVQLTLAALAAYVLAIHCVAVPPPTKVSEAFLAQSRLGKWIYLTRHCLTLQAVHQSLSLFAGSSAWLAALTHGNAIWIGALGFFVTMQYFLLVTPSKGFKAECDTWRERGVQFKQVSHFLHIPAAAIAAVDLVFVRDPLIMRAAFSLTATLALAAIYSLAYLGMIMWNFKMTAHWPYSMLNDFGTDVKKWSAFTVQQVAVMAVLVVVAWALVWLRRVLAGAA